MILSSIRRAAKFVANVVVAAVMSVIDFAVMPTVRIVRRLCNMPVEKPGLGTEWSALLGYWVVRLALIPVMAAVSEAVALYIAIAWLVGMILVLADRYLPTRLYSQSVPVSKTTAVAA